MNRRAFLRGLLATPAIVAASSLMPISVKALDLCPPKLWGDGINDDTKALQYLLDRGGLIDLRHGVYRLTNTLHVHRDAALINGTLRNDVALPIVYVDAGANMAAADLCFDWKGLNV